MEHWTKAAIVRAIQDWVALYGSPPRLKDWNGPYRPEGYPHAGVVKYHFGSLGAAVMAAGFSPRPRGAPGHSVPIDYRFRPDGKFAPLRGQTLSSRSKPA
jgi:hypothetical protein